MSVFRRPDLRSPRPKSIFSQPRNRAIARLCPLPKNLPLHPRSSLFNPHLLPTGVRSRRSLHESPSVLQVESTSASHYWVLTFFGLSFCRKRFLRLEINYPFHHFH
ncbi:hypothetical protein AVEN_112885-1 [Araneus ventricosus]|uniref:Uncharacterized protein n=1 Tax=Araneus ventricosus TaxID=182803 RepID=A0A4Y2SWG1_ARAVE|nr:hypothetical protein AVEN_112885-1 [Araneus ventricosus]